MAREYIGSSAVAAHRAGGGGPFRARLYNWTLRWMGATHFLTKTIPRVSTEMSLHILAYNLKRMINLLGATKMVQTLT